MSRTAALIRARSLREALLDHGVPKVSIEIQQGRPGTPHSRWYDDRFVGSMGHHIVSRRSQGLTPGLALIKRGRSDVPGPLCNGYGGFDRVARIICMGWANHPGAGGPYALPSGRIPANTGRPYLFGWEHEGGLVLADWTDEFRNFMGSCHAGTLDWLGLRDTSHIEHKTWTDRKIDRLGYTLTSARAEVRDNWGDTMSLDKDDVRTIARTDGVFDAPPDSPGAKSGKNKHWHLNSLIRNITNHVLYRKDLWWKIRLPWLGSWTDHEGTEERYPNGYTAQANLVHSHRLSRENHLLLKEMHAEAAAFYAEVLERLEEMATGERLSDEQAQELAERFAGRVRAELDLIQVTVGVEDADPAEDEPEPDA